MTTPTLLAAGGYFSKLVVDIINGEPGAWARLLIFCVALGACYWAYNWWLDQD